MWRKVVISPAVISNTSKAKNILQNKSLRIAKVSDWSEYWTTKIDSNLWLLLEDRSLLKSKWPTYLYLQNMKQLFWPDSFLFSRYARNASGCCGDTASIQCPFETYSPCISTYTTKSRYSAPWAAYWNTCIEAKAACAYIIHLPGNLIT